MISINIGEKYKIGGCGTVTVLCIAGEDVFVEWEDGTHGILSYPLMMKHIDEKIEE